MSFESTHEQGQSSGDQVEGLSEEQRQAYKEFTDYIGDRLNELLPPSLEAWSRDVSNLAVTLSEASPEDYANSSYVNDQIERAGISDEAKEVVLQVVNDYRDAIYEQGGSATTETPAEVFGMEERNANVGFDETKTYTLDDAYEAFQTEGMERLNNALEDIKNREFASSAEAAEAIMIALGEVASEVDRGEYGIQYGVPVMTPGGNIGFVSLKAYDDAFTAILNSESSLGQRPPDEYFRPSPNNELMTEVLRKHFKKVA